MLKAAQRSRLSRPFPRTETAEGSAPCGPFLGIIVSSDSEIGGPFEIPCPPPHQATGIEQKSRDGKFTARGSPHS